MQMQTRSLRSARSRRSPALLTAAVSAGLIAIVMAMSASGAIAAPIQPANSSVATAGQPNITSVAFSGNAGSGQASPTITITGFNLGSAPAGTSDNNTSCGGYSANGDVYGTKLYFLDDSNFEAGYSSSTGANCVGIVVDSWTSSRIVLQFGNAYGTFAHWYLSNGDGFALSLKTGLFGGVVSGLS